MRVLQSVVQESRVQAPLALPEVLLAGCSWFLAAGYQEAVKNGLKVALNSMPAHAALLPFRTDASALTARHTGVHEVVRMARQQICV